MNTISRNNYAKSCIATTDQDGYVKVTFGNDVFVMTAYAAEMLADEILTAARQSVIKPERFRVIDHGNRMERSDGGAEAVRYYKSEGAAFSGWIVRSTHDSYSYSDPIANKAEARHWLLTWDNPDADRPSAVA